MQIVLIRKNEISRTVLPQKVSGQHHIHCDINGENKLLFAVSAADGKWVIKENKNIELLGGYVNDENDCKKIIVSENEYYPIRHLQLDEKMIILVEPIEEERATFKLYDIPSNGVITVGHVEENTVAFRDNLLSETVNARIEYLSNGGILVKDVNSINGTYLNGRRILEDKAHYGDEIYLVGLRIILGKGFIAVNNPSGSVTVSLKLRESLNFKLREDEDEETEQKDTFSSAPRFKRGIVTKRISIDAPPTPRDEQSLPWAVVMGPSITMAFGSIFSSMFTIQNILQNDGDISSALPTLIMAVCMVLGTIIWPFFARRFEKRSRIAKELFEKREYREYLMKIGDDIEQTIAEQEEIKRQNNPSIDECISRINGEKMTLWERSPKHDDFLDVMIGIGSLPASIELSYQQRTATEKINESSERLQELAESEKILKAVPITIPFASSQIAGLIGKRESVISTTKALLIELTALHNYNDLKIIFIYSEQERHIWDFVKWMPHAWNNEKTVRYVANDVDEAKELSGFLSNIQAMYSSDHVDLDDAPYYLIVAADRTLASKIQALKEFVQSPSKYKNISMLALYDERKYLPKGCATICSIEDSGATLSDYNNITDKPIIIENPVSYPGDPEDIFVNMANIELDIVSKEGHLPTELTYFEMYKVGMPEYLDVMARWEENDSVKALSVPIGVDADGYMINLDIHEKAHGPHGLIAGMTGSGKSEFIISYIASMAINYSPEEVAFVLIDFKGGGMADVFKDLPHLAGSITNLDGNELQRSFIAIESELEKRQSLFKEISEQKKISNIDIYKYQKLRRDDKALKPLPHLVIISDEFAELKQQHSDFMEQLIRIARIGRSLGVHLILATQKPDGVVDDQIKSNIKFKVCLKVQDKSDSQSVIGRPDATMITNAGRFYLQVGYNELFEYGQSPWSGASYYPDEQYHQTNDKRIDVLNEQGRVIYRIAPPPKPKSAGIPEKQIDALVSYLRSFADEKGYVCEKLWLAPLEGPVEEKKKTDADDLEYHPYVLNPVVGMYDDLQHQKHRVLTVPLTNGGNTIVYGASGSGKLAFLNQLIVSMVETHSPEEVKIYAIDFDAGALSAFDHAPHIGRVVLSNEFDALQAVFEDIEEELAKRRELFRRFGGDYQTFVKSSGETVPNIVLIINNFLAFTEEYSVGEETVAKIAREGRKYGIFVVITSMDSTGVRYSLVPLFSNLFVLQQNNEEQYESILGKTSGITPSRFKGRGIFKRGDVTYEFQTKMVFEDHGNTYEAIDKFCKDIADNSMYQKQELKVMPSSINREYFENLGYTFTLEGFPVAVSVKDKEPITFDFSKSKATIISYDDDNIAAVNALYSELKECEAVSMILDAESLDISEDARIRSSSDAISEAIAEIEGEVFARAEQAQKSFDVGNGLPDFGHFTIIIRNYSALCSSVNDDVLAHLNGTISGITDNYHIHFIIMDNVFSFRESFEVDRLGAAAPFAQGIAITEDSRAQRFFSSEIKFSASCEKGQGYVVIDGRARLGKMISREED